MDSTEFKKQAVRMLDYIISDRNAISERPLITNVQPGHLRHLLPESAPETGEPFSEIMDDFTKYIMPGLNNRLHPGFHAYYPFISSYPSILGQMLKNAFACTGYNWNLCNAEKDLEKLSLNWFGKMIGLPESFLSDSDEKRGGAFVQNSTGACLTACMITARQKSVKRVTDSRSPLSTPIQVASLIAYCSKEAHVIIERSAAFAMVNLKALDTDENFCLRGETLALAIQEDLKIGLIPFFVYISLGSHIGSSDRLDEIGSICEKYDLWLNVDASYGGNALLCPEYRHYLNGIEFATSFNINPTKWLMVHLDCSISYVKDLNSVTENILVDKTKFTYKLGTDWLIGTNASSQYLKFWIVMRSFGVEYLQQHIRNHFQLAKSFCDNITADGRFEVLICDFGKVCFRLNDSDEVNRKLLDAVNSSGKLFLDCFYMKDKRFLSFVICSEEACEKDVKDACIIVKVLADNVLENKSEDKMTEV